MVNSSLQIKNKFYRRACSVCIMLLVFNALLAACQQQVVQDDSLQSQFAGHPIYSNGHVYYSFPPNANVQGNGPAPEEYQPGQFIYNPVEPTAEPGQ